MTRFLLNHDKDVAQFVADRLDAAISGRLLGAVGILSPAGDLVGGCVLHNWTRRDAELSYYGPGTITRDLTRLLGEAWGWAGLGRLSCRVKRSNKRLQRALPRFGFVYEGISRRYFGPDRGDDAINYGMLAEEAERWFRKPAMRRAA